MNMFELLGIFLRPDSQNNILEKIKKYIEKPSGFFHIVSINPENIITARQNSDFKKVIETAQIQIMDGSGILWASKVLGGPALTRLTGVDLMETLMKMAGKERRPTMLIGGFPKIAYELAECYSQDYPQSKFLGVTGIKDIKNPQKKEEDELFSIVRTYMPQIVFVSFGSPDQELWIEKHKKHFEGAVCMGVGGAFDFLTGRVGRAPKFVRSVGLEWLYRLLSQPWRWRRQIQLIKFIGLILKERFI